MIYKNIYLVIKSKKIIWKVNPFVRSLKIHSNMFWRQFIFKWLNEYFSLGLNLVDIEKLSNYLFILLNWIFLFVLSFEYNLWRKIFNSWTGVKLLSYRLYFCLYYFLILWLYWLLGINWILLLKYLISTWWP